MLPGMDGSVVKQPKRGVNTTCELAQHANHWHMDEAKARFVERYLQGDLGRNERRSCGEAEDYGLVFVVAPNGPHSRKVHRQGDLSWPWSDFDQPLMLSQNVELVQGIKMPVTSEVWLQRFDRRNFGLRKPLFAFDTFLYPTHLALKVPRELPNGEVGILARLHAVPARERCRKQVESAAHCIDDRADLSVDDRIEESEAIRDQQDLARTLRIRLSDDRIWASADIGDDALFKNWDMGYGPVECGLGVYEIAAHG